MSRRGKWTAGVLGGLGLAFLLSWVLPAGQTWWLRRLWLDARPAWQVEALAVGWGELKARGVAWRGDGFEFRSEELTARGLGAGWWRGDWSLEDLELRGVTLINHVGADASDSPAPSSSALPDNLRELREVFRLPAAVAIQRVKGEGTWRIVRHGAYAATTQARFSLSGSLGPGTPAKWEYRFSARREEVGGSWVDLGGRIAGQLRYANPRELNEIVLNAHLTASGPRFPNGAFLSMRTALGRQGEALTIDAQAFASGDSDARELLSVRAATDTARSSVKGSWSLDVNQSDVSPYLLGASLPLFSIKANGGFVLQDRLRVAGEWDASGDLPPSWVAPLRFDGVVNSRGVFDVQTTEDGWRIHRFSSRWQHRETFLAVQLLQGADYSPSSDRWQVANPEGDLVAVELRQAPLALWPGAAGAWYDSARLVTASLYLQNRGGVWHLRSTTPLQATADFPASSLVGSQAVLVSSGLLATWSKEQESWQFTQAEVRNEQGLLLAGSASGSRRADAWEGRADLGLEVARLPWHRQAVVPLSAGRVEITAVAQASPRQATWQAQIDLNTSRLSTGEGRWLAPLSTSLRWDRNAQGEHDFEIPLTWGEGRQVSDLLVLLHVPAGTPSRWQAVMTSKRLDLDQVRPWLLLGQAPVSDAPDSSAPSLGGLPWPGELKLSLARLELVGQPAPWGAEGVLRISPQEVEVSPLIIHGPGGSKIQVGGALQRAEVYRYRCEVTADQFDPSPLIKWWAPERPPLVEGKFDLKLSAQGQSSSLQEAWSKTQATLSLTGRRGTFHAFDEEALVADFRRSAGGSSRLNQLIGKAASLFTNVDRRIAAGTGFMRRLAAIQYDQATLEVSVRPGEELQIRELTLLSPELRLIGRGTLGTEAHLPLAQRPVRLVGEFSVRGQNERDLRILGLLGDEPDSLGYFPLGKRIRIEGTPRDLGTQGLAEVLANAIER